MQWVAVSGVLPVVEHAHAQGGVNEPSTENGHGFHECILANSSFGTDKRSSTRRRQIGPSHQREKTLSRQGAA
jgi:hypothetical protein